MKLKVKPMPFIMTVLSAIYFVYVMSSEDTILMADAIGGDPGGKLLPMIMSVFLFLGFLYITIRERPDGQDMDADTKKLFCITLVLSLLYVFLIRIIGFVLLSAILLFCLEFIYNSIGEKQNWKQLIYGCIGTTAVTGIGYFIMRLITKNLMSLGRANVLPEIFTVTTFEACISLLYVAGLTFLMHKSVCQKLRTQGFSRISNAGLLTMATVLFLYVVFKQFFSVNLAVGLLNF